MKKCKLINRFLIDGKVGFKLVLKMGKYKVNYITLKIVILSFDKSGK